MHITVVALGKIGLPLAVQFASKGHEVTGVDINEKTVRLVNRGEEPFPGEAQLAEHWRGWCMAGTLRATADYGVAIPGADAVVIVVPLFVDDQTWEPDFGWMDAATRSLGEHLTAGTLVSYETTLPVGTTRSRWKPMLEKGSGLVEGTDFHVVFSPERVLAGRVFADLRKYPKLVGGLSPEGAATRPGVLRGRARLRRAPRPRPWPTVSGTWAAPRPPRWPSSPKPPTATSTSAWPTSSRGSPRATESMSCRSSRRPTLSRTATSTDPESRSEATASPSTHASTFTTTPRPPLSGRPARRTWPCRVCGRAARGR